MLASKKRETKETSIEVSVDPEGSGKVEIETGIEMLDEILFAFAVGARFDLAVKARGDRETGDHHTTEDVGITLGRALGEVIKRGIGSSIVPSGQAVAQVAVRFGEPGFRSQFQLQNKELGGMMLENFSHLLRTLATSANFTLAVSADGGDDKSKIDAMCTALGRAVRRAIGDEKN
ncbi:MAG: imidazoleglycerol-phosphate dehydratase [Methanosaeta sp. PtaB.Bin018]|jgi:imidazoleglycerol-phosphate dehydratase|nr:imidazoleglycerol-phosphate dehydratase [Methanothrix sp.]OPX75566.1 MAG: imidazoleglycerol-phosphate dehydratase [Methanosaeta sp. PtaB.Bin018]OPY46366.1 MAG: imidazoleglycerol-phosphate dehydratase [Methanosaeta sp. PtaU1.Bin016]HOV51372.1 imidazoleglycerol-phosphate dehydratase [Methanothrix sp.]